MRQDETIEMYVGTPVHFTAGIAPDGMWIISGPRRDGLFTIEKVKGRVRLSFAADILRKYNPVRGR